MGLETTSRGGCAKRSPTNAPLVALPFVILRSGPRAASRRTHCRGAAAGQERQNGKIAADQRLFLVSAPALDLTLGRGSVVQTFKVLMEHQNDRTPASGVTMVSARLMLGHSSLQAPDRRADIIRAIGATKHVEISAHGFLQAVRPSRRALRALLRMTEDREEALTRCSLFLYIEHIMNPPKSLSTAPGRHKGGAVRRKRERGSGSGRRCCANSISVQIDAPTGAGLGMLAAHPRRETPRQSADPEPCRQGFADVRHTPALRPWRPPAITIPPLRPAARPEPAGTGESG